MTHEKHAVLCLSILAVSFAFTAIYAMDDRDALKSGRDTLKQHVALLERERDALRFQVEGLQHDRDTCRRVNAEGDKVNSECLKNNQDFQDMLTKTLDNFIACRKACRCSP